MVVNGHALLKKAPIRDMLCLKLNRHGASYGLAESVMNFGLRRNFGFKPQPNKIAMDRIAIQGELLKFGRFCIASAIEEFDMPSDLVGIVHDKSTWARKGLSVFNTVIEPGWRGFLTLELVYHGQEELHLPAGIGIAQVLFHQVTELASYAGKYQNQEDRPVEAKHG